MKGVDKELISIEKGESYVTLRTWAELLTENGAGFIMARNTFDKVAKASCCYRAIVFGIGV